MATLADELRLDFEDSGSEAGGHRDDDGFLDDDDEAAALMGTNGDVEMDAADLLSSDEDEEMDGVKEGRDNDQTEALGDLASVAALLKNLDPVLKKITHYQSQAAETQSYLGNLEDHPEYQLLTQSNALSTSIDGEIVLAHKWIKDHYSVRFPELETLVGNPIEYANAVGILGNTPLNSDNMKKIPSSTNNHLGTSLESVLDRPTLMVVTTSAITSKGRELTRDEHERIILACQMVIQLDKARRTLTDYVQSRMNMFAPNLTAIIGSLTAAQLLNAVGSLSGLSNTPSCNISAWGAKKGANASALATNVTVRQQGYLFHSPLIRTIPTDLKKQAMRIVSGKVVIAARVDLSRTAPDGREGEKLREACLERLDKLTEKPLNKGARALPVPDDKPARKRGGRRARKAKEAVAMTDLRKAQNRMAFGQEEKEVGYGVGDSTAGMGMIGAANDGRVRGLQIDHRTRAKLSAKSKGWGGATSVAGAASSLRGFGPGAGGPGHLDLRGKGLRTSGVGTTVGTGGTASSLAFTPVQGLELVDPSVRAEMNRKRKAEDDRYFKGGTFTQVGGDGGGGGGGGDAGVFKKPDLPPAKRVNTGAGKAA